MLQASQPWINNMDERPYIQVTVVSHSQALVLMKSTIGTTQHKHSRRFLEHIHSFLIQVIEGATRRAAVHDFILTNKKGIVDNMKIEGNLSCSDNEIATEAFP